MSRRSRGARAGTARTAGLALVVLLATSVPAPAASVRAVSFDALVTNAALVFEGVVTAREAVVDARTGIVRTVVTFRVVEVVKGRHDAATARLSFLGGTASGVTMHVEGMRLPERGEHGVYFVERYASRLAHPLHGWSQGHFVSRLDDQGVRRVLTAGRRPVLAVDAPAAARALSSGVATTVRTAPGIGAALSMDAFKREIRARLGE